MVDRKSSRVGSNSKLKIQNRKFSMKSSYELAMERLNKTAPTPKLTAAQKKQMAELDSKYTAKIAEREIALKDEIAKTPTEDVAKQESLREQLVFERKKLQAELEEKKEQIRLAK
jgi:hypothetical protein